jgi:dTMP kinase
MKFDVLQGKFLVIDGPDGAGKSTQAKLLAEFIRQQGVDTLLCRDPGGTRIGDKIRHILLDNDHGEMSVRCEALLYMASRAQLYDERIAPALAAGRCVLCDRWVSSTYAYQAVAGRLGADAVIRIAEASLARTWPDLTIILDLPAEAGLDRLGRSPDRMEQKGSEFHQHVRQAFLELARGRKDFTVVDANGPIEAVQQRLERVVTDYVNS